MKTCHPEEQPLSNIIQHVEIQILQMSALWQYIYNSIGGLSSIQTHLQNTCPKAPFVENQPLKHYHCTLCDHMFSSAKQHDTHVVAKHYAQI